MVQARDMPRHPVRNYPSGHLGGWPTPWLAEEKLDGQSERVDIPAHARTAHKGFLQKRLEGDLCSLDLHVPPTIQSVKGLNRTELTELNCKGLLAEQTTGGFRPKPYKSVMARVR